MQLKLPKDYNITLTLVSIFNTDLHVRWKTVIRGGHPAHICANSVARESITALMANVGSAINVN